MYVYTLRCLGLLIEDDFTFLLIFWKGKDSPPTLYTSIHHMSQLRRLQPTTSWLIGHPDTTRLKSFWSFKDEMKLVLINYNQAHPVTCCPHKRSQSSNLTRYTSWGWPWKGSEMVNGKPWLGRVHLSLFVNLYVCVLFKGKKIICWYKHRSFTFIELLLIRTCFII